MNKKQKIDKNTPNTNIKSSTKKGNKTRGWGEGSAVSDFVTHHSTFFLCLFLSVNLVHAST